ncbi:SNW domain-containing protein 1 [Fasciola hepatica]|uniref:SNW domain-containing protein 1 n=1 Tax=Fasciola hepatica TaxID=6192 RepID=A0A2H1C9U3_FASHE|nr:SNW domain-containing protein 1 [Fasciola hepatica]
MSLLSHLPVPVQRQQDDPSTALSLSVGSRVLVAKSTIPPYGHRKNWVPRTPEDFADGGAFPEIHLPQFPLDMGRQKSESNALVMKTDQEGKIRYDELVRQGHSKDRVIYSRFTDLLPKTIEEDDPELSKPSQETIQEITEKTRKALESLVEQKVAAAAPVRRAEKTNPAEYIRYTPSQQGLAFNSGAKQRLVRMVEMQKDPMEPPRFKINQKIPRGPPSPPPPLMHSPARKVTVKEQQDWKIPPCISNWKNPRGYTIPLDKRVAADGRGLQTVHINENFAKLAEALYTADRKAREAVEMRAQIERKVAQKQKERKEEQLQRIAQLARESRAGLRRPGQVEAEADDDPSVTDREELRRDRAKERVRDRNLARSNTETKAKAQKDKERDISEQIALGLPNPRVANNSEAQFDQRLFNQSRGLDSGFAGGTDDLYNVYDKPWRGESDLGSRIYRPRQKDVDTYGADLEAIKNTRRFAPAQEFSGTDPTRRLDGPVQFEHDEEDPFNLSEFLSEAKRAPKRPGESISTESSNRDTTHRKRDRKD